MCTYDLVAFKAILGLFDAFLCMRCVTAPIVPGAAPEECGCCSVSGAATVTV